jgi:hypothetical protein
VMLELVLWCFWTGWTSVLFFLFLCSCYLATYQAACRCVAGSSGGKGFIWTLPCSPGRQQGLATLSDSLTCVCVCCVACTLPCEQAGCVCGLSAWYQAWFLAESGSARQSWSYLLCYHFLSNLPSGNATWHN